jgi:4-amino-4-deoxy-L-arabinose transferase-like glycosyltransferase
MAPSPANSSRWLLPAIALALVAATVWLRAPTFGFKTWNVDEAIHAAVARTLLDGGVLYRDAVDQRTPLTYGVMTAIFAVAGENNFYAVHVAVALVIAATAWLLLLVARRMGGLTSGLWAAVLYIILAGGLFYQGDANAFVTEWFVAFFTSAAAWIFWAASGTPGWRRLVCTGAAFSLAGLSKQPGAIDLAAPGLTLAYLAARDATPDWRQLWRQWSGLILGFIAVLAAVLAYYALRGAFHDFIFYTWTYNLRFYGPEVGWTDRMSSAGVPFRLLVTFSPLLLVVLVAAACIFLYKIVQRQPTTGEATDNPARVYIFIWALSSLIGAASGGRGFDHYSIQFLPPLCLGIAWLLGRLTEGVIRGSYRLPGRLIASVVLLLVAAGLVPGTFTARLRTLPVDPSRRVAQFMAERSAPNESIFVWGYHPDLYVFANRKPASRFVYASFLTGLIPWTNCAPYRATDYTIVPGAMETLLRELEANRPVFFVDCSVGPNRHWDKYPLEKFPPLSAFVRERYLRIESGQFLPQGFALYALKDAYRPTRPPLPAAALASTRAGGVDIFAVHHAETRSVRINVGARDSAGKLHHVELSLDGQPLDSVTLSPGEGLSVDFEVNLEPGSGVHRLRARAVCTDGIGYESPVHELDSNRSLLPARELAAFKLMEYRGRLIPLEGSAPYGASAALEDGRMIYFAHAPSRLLYELPAGACVLRGGMGFRPGAFAADNHGPTDGAEFRVDLLTAAGERVNLHRRLFQPVQNPADRIIVPFHIDLPPGTQRRIELVIDPGPGGNAASDWTFWSDLTLENCR